MSGPVDPIEDGAGNILRQQTRGIPADVVVMPEHNESGNLDRLQRAMHAKKRSPLTQHLRQGVS